MRGPKKQFPVRLQIKVTEQMKADLEDAASVNGEGAAPIVRAAIEAYQKSKDWPRRKP